MPDSDFDIEIRLTLTREQPKDVKTQSDLYRFLPSNVNFEYFDDDGFYPIFFRALRFKLTDSSYEAIITNLDKDEFLPP